MPPRSKIDQLPEELKGQLDRKLIEGGFSGYEDLAAWLTEQGFQIGKSALGVYGLSLQRRLDSIKASTEAARLVAQAAPDESDERSNATIAILQTDMFDALLAMQEAEEEPDQEKRVAILAKAARAIADLSRASVSRNKWAAEVRERAATAAEAAQKIAKKGGLSAEAVAEIRGAILGIAQ